MNAAFRMQTTAGRLACLGFADGARAERLLDALGPEAVADFELLDDLVSAADPDLALISLEPAGGERPERPRRAARRPRPAPPPAPGLRPERRPRRPRACATSEHVTAPEPEDPPSHREELLFAVGADPDAADPIATGENALNALRVAYRGRLLHLAGLDVTGVLTLAEIAAELSDLAAAALDAALAIARAETPGWEQARLAVIGMGKCGARELNYISDVDVIFVAEPKEGVDEALALKTATKLAQAMMRACTTSTPRGLAVGGRRRAAPRGQARAPGPDPRQPPDLLPALGQDLGVPGPAEGPPGRRRHGARRGIRRARQRHGVEAAARENFVEDVQAMRRRVEAHVRVSEAERQIKLGPGGLRDIEFAVQLLQLVHGRTDPMLRRRATLPALAALSRGGYVGRDDAKALAEAYSFLRHVEHLLQLHRLRRTHVVPSDSADLRRIGRGLGMVTDPVGEFTTTWKRHALEVRRLHEKLFYRPLLQAAARLPSDETRLSTSAAQARLEALGYADPSGALRHISALTSGVSRRAAIQRTLLPVMLGWFADAPDPDAGLLGFRQISDKLGATPWYLRLLRDETARGRTAGQAPGHLRATSRRCCCTRPTRSACWARPPTWPSARSRRCTPRPTRPCPATARTSSRRWRRSGRCGGGSCSGWRAPT